MPKLGLVVHSRKTGLAEQGGEFLLVGEAADRFDQ